MVQIRGAVAGYGGVVAVLCEYKVVLISSTHFTH